MLCDRGLPGQLACVPGQMDVCRVQVQHLGAENIIFEVDDYHQL